MNDQQRAAMQMALEALWICCEHNKLYHGETHNTVIEATQTITALREVLAQPQENTARCGGCNKTAKDGWALYCVECWEKSNGDPFAASGKPIDHIAASGKVIAEPVKQEPVAWHEPNAYGNVTTHKKWAEENGWLPLYTKE